MSRPKQDQISESDLVGFKYFKPLGKLLRRLHDVGTARDKAGNRRLFMDQYVTLLLLFMFNPTCSSLRALQQASTLKKVQRRLGVPQSSLSSLSEAARVFDPQALKALVEQMSDQLPALSGHDPKLASLREVITLVDGTVMSALSRVGTALFGPGAKPGLKLHMHFELLRGVPVSARITDRYGSERTQLASSLQPDRLYVLDRGYHGYGLFRQILDAGSSFVARLQDQAAWRVIQTRELSAEDRAAGVLEDVVVHLGSTKDKDAFDGRALRVVRVACEPYERRPAPGAPGAPGGSKRCRDDQPHGNGPSQGESLLIATNRLDLPADVIALLYRHRWQIEIFFRFFKHVLGCRHLLSHHRNGIELQVYAAILACLIIARWTAGKPTLRTFEMICYYLAGMADDHELHRHMVGLKP